MGFAMKNADPAVEAVKSMLADLANFKQISAVEASIYNAGGLMFSVSIAAQRNGAQVWAKLFHASAPSDRKLTNVLLAATLYDLWPKKCMELFSSKTHSGASSFWVTASAAKMLKIVEKATKDGAPIHPAVAQLAANVQSQISKLPKPIDMHIDDIKQPLKMAIKKGASREDLIRLVDEAIAESVMRS